MILLNIIEKLNLGRRYPHLDLGAKNGGNFRSDLIKIVTRLYPKRCPTVLKENGQKRGSGNKNSHRSCSYLSAQKFPSLGLGNFFLAHLMRGRTCFARSRQVGGLVRS